MSIQMSQHNASLEQLTDFCTDERENSSFSLRLVSFSMEICRKHETPEAKEESASKTTGNLCSPTENFLLALLLCWQHEVDAVAFEVVALIGQAESRQMLYVNIWNVFLWILSIAYPSFFVVEPSRDNSENRRKTRLLVGALPDEEDFEDDRILHGVSATRSMSNSL
jgi:hypothetical protein